MIETYIIAAVKNKKNIRQWINYHRELTKIDAFSIPINSIQEAIEIVITSLKKVPITVPNIIKINKTTAAKIKFKVQAEPSMLSLLYWKQTYFYLDTILMGRLADKIGPKYAKLSYALILIAFIIINLLFFLFRKYKKKNKKLDKLNSKLKKKSEKLLEEVDD
jgi:hypothetical protein